MVKLLVPPSNVGVLPRTLFAELTITTVWEIAELLVNLIVTLPAFAVSLLVSNMSMSSIGARLTVLELLAAGGRFGAGVFVVDAGAGSLPGAPRRYARISAFWPGPLGKLAAVMTVSPTTPT